MRRVPVLYAVLLAVLWIATGIAAEKSDTANGKSIYNNFCASCHGNAGKGDGPAAAALNPKPKDLTDKAYMSKLDDKYLFQ